MLSNSLKSLMVDKFLLILPIMSTSISPSPTNQWCILRLVRENLTLWHHRNATSQHAWRAAFTGIETDSWVWGETDISLFTVDLDTVQLEWRYTKEPQCVWLRSGFSSWQSTQKSLIPRPKHKWGLHRSRHNVDLKKAKSVINEINRTDWEKKIPIKGFHSNRRQHHVTMTVWCSQQKI